MKRKRRVRFHLLDPTPEMRLPSIEGLLVGGAFVSWLRREYRIALPTLIAAPEPAKPQQLASKQMRIPRERVAFYEVL